MDIGQIKICPNISDNVLIPVWASMTSKFITDYEFDIGEFLVWELRVR